MLFIKYSYYYKYLGKFIINICFIQYLIYYKYATKNSFYEHIQNNHFIMRNV